MARTLTVDIGNIAPFLREYPVIRLFSRRIGGAGILKHPIFAGVHQIHIPTGQTSTNVDIPASSEYTATQEYMLSIGGREYVFVMPDEDATLSNLLLRGSSQLAPVLVQETEPLDPLIGSLWIKSSTQELSYWIGGPNWQRIGTVATGGEITLIRETADGAVQLGSIDLTGRTITFVDDEGNINSVDIPGVSIYEDGNIQGNAGEITEIEFVSGTTFDVSVSAERATITIPHSEESAVNDLEGRVSQIEEFEDTFRVRTEVTASQRVVVGTTNTAYDLTTAVKVPALQPGRDQEVEVTVQATAIPDGTIVFNLKSLLDKVPIVRANTQMSDTNSISFSNAPGDNNKYRIGRDTSGDWFFTSDTADTYFVSIAVTVLKESGLAADAVRDEVKAQIEAGTDISVTPSGSGANQTLRIDYTGTPVQFADSDDIEFDQTGGEWSANPKGKLTEIINAFQDGGWERVNGTAAQVPFVSDVSYSTEPTGITGYTFAIEGRNNTAFSNYNHIVVRMPSDLEYKTTRYRLATFTIEGQDNHETQLTTINMDNSNQVALLGTDDGYTYLKVNVSPALGGQERYRMEVFNEFTFNKAKLDLTSDEISDFIPRSEHVASNDGKDVVYNHAEDTFKLRTTEKIAIANLPVWTGTSAQFTTLTREDGIIYLVTD